MAISQYPAELQESYRYLSLRGAKRRGNPFLLETAVRFHVVYRGYGLPQPVCELAVAMTGNFRLGAAIFT